jgi:hypothetical protein
MSVWSEVWTSRPVPRQRVEPARAVPDDPPVTADVAARPWRVLAPDGAVELRDPDVAALRALPSGTSVVLLADGPGSRHRLRRRAARGGVEVQRELVAVPRTSAPLALVDDEEAAVRHFWTRVVAVPPGSAWSRPVLGAVLLVGRRLPWRATGLLAPGRVVVGRRT